MVENFEDIGLVVNPPKRPRHEASARGSAPVSANLPAPESVTVIRRLKDLSLDDLVDKDVTVQGVNSVLAWHTSKKDVYSVPLKPDKVDPTAFAASLCDIERLI